MKRIAGFKARKRVSEPQSREAISRNRDGGFLNRIRSSIGPLFDDWWFFKSIRSLTKGPNKLIQPPRQVAPVYVAIGTIARELAKVPFRVYSGAPEDKKREPVSDPNDETVRLFAKPGPLLVRSQLFELIAWQRRLFGGSALLFTDENGDHVLEGEHPAMITAFNARKFEKRWDKENPALFLGFKVTQEKGEPIEYKPHEVALLYYVDPYNPRDGFLAPMTAARLAAEQDLSAKMFNSNFFKNDATPGLVISIDGTMQVDELEEIKADWQDRHGGEENVNVPAFLPQGAKVEKVTQSHKESCLTDVLTWQRDEIHGVFGVNKFSAGIIDDVNRASALAAKEQLYDTVLEPEMRYIEDVLNPAVMEWTDGKKSIGFDPSGIEALQQGRTERADRAGKLHAIGWTPNELNEHLDLGMNEIPAPEGGDSRIVSAAGKKLAIVAGLEEDPNAPDMDPDDEDDDEDLEDEDDEKASRNVLRGAARAAGLGKLDRATWWRAFERQSLTPFERKMRPKLKKLFFRLQKETLGNLAKVAAAKDETGEASADGALARAELTSRTLNHTDIDRILFDAKKAGDSIVNVLGPIYEEIIENAIAVLDEELTGGVNIVSSSSEELIKVLEEKKILVRGVTDRVIEQLRRGLGTLVDNGETIQAIADKIRDQFKFARARSLTIARTETGQMQAGARFEAMRVEGVRRHQWITARDDEVRETHEDQDGVIRTIGEAFPNGLLFPLQPTGKASEIINCRCAAVAVEEDEDVSEAA